MSWTATRLKHLCVDAGQYGLNVAAQDYTSSGHRLIRTSDIDENGGLRSRENAVFIDTSLDSRHELKDGDLLLSRSGTLGRAMLLRDLEEPSTYAGYLVRFRPRPSVEPRFMAYLAASRLFQAAIEADAVTSTIQNFNAERYANIAVSLPTIDEQRRIADFLDAETARIDQLVSSMSGSLNLLQAKRRALLMSIFPDSECGSARLGYYLDLVTSGPRGWGEYVGSKGTPFFRSANLRRDSIDPNLESLALVDVPPSASAEAQRSMVRVGDVLIGITGANTGWVSLVDRRIAQANVSQHVCLARPSKAVEGRWLAYALSAPQVQELLLGSQYGGTKTQLSLGDIRDLVVTLPSVDEQRRLVADIDKGLAVITAESALRNDQLALLAERRQALITAAVTGQIDVTTARGVDTSGLSLAGGGSA
ncbi:restriction endonuclease subunit S [Nonomuraea sp. NPDC050663]|uniref:restriction endonuclease subunit S n=1 Tax=Nonomuraea sp. NPDC050663 TaxID=3364370 RepID=UPI0037895A7A